MEDLEEYYENENEKNNEEFIGELKENKDVENVEREYKNRTKALRKKYEKEFRKNLESEKKKEIEKIRNKTKPRKLTANEAYQVKSLDMELGWKEKTYLEGVSRGYKLRRKLNDIYEKTVPNSVIYFNYKVKKNVKRTYTEIIDFISDTFNTIVLSLGQFIVGTGKFFTSFFDKINEKVKNIVNKLKKKKEEKKDNGKKEDSSSTNKKSSTN
jgi:hypothetical protein